MHEYAASQLPDIDPAPLTLAEYDTPVRRRLMGCVAVQLAGWLVGWVAERRGGH